VLVVDKTKGPTSHDIVAMVRRGLQTREVGHAGTLDPMATGVLVVAVGEATKLVPYLTATTKSYVARLALGVETDTLDAAGKPVREAAVPPGLLAELARWPADCPALTAALERERARTAQQPPAYSAIHTDGERAYARARRGESVTLADREVRVHGLEVVGAGVEPRPWVDLTLVVDKGYYVRSLGRDLAERLGTVGHLVALRRTRSAPFSIEEALPLPAQPDALRAALIPLVDAARRALPTVNLPEPASKDARCGRPIATEAVTPAPPEGPAVWLAPDGDLVAIGQFKDGIGSVLRGFRPSPS